MTSPHREKNMIEETNIIPPPTSADSEASGDRCLSACSDSLGQRVDVLKRAKYESLEYLLNALCSFGAPKLFRMDCGWHCDVKMHVAAKGTSFDVMSDFGCETSMAAAKQCAERIIATMQSINSQNV